jgi:c-src tyrosine kinase
VDDAPLLLHPCISKEPLKYYIDKKTLQNIWGLKSDKLEIVKSVGQGEFGEVYAGTYRGLQVAVKSIPKEKEDGPSMQSFLQEASIMTHLKHKNLMRLVGVVFEGLVLKRIVLEFMSKGSLSKYLSSRGRSVVAQTELVSFARDVCEGMIYISGQGFVHRDLAARNVLLNSQGQAKISDFGLARRAEDHVANEGGKFPVKWTAPEALKDSVFSEKSDVWSFGICLWEIFSFGRIPYPSILAENVLQQLDQGYFMEQPDECPDGIYDVMMQCWQYEPAVRPTFRVVQTMLGRSFGESRTPCSSPMLGKKNKTEVSEKISRLLKTPVASDVYLEAPSTKSTTLCMANIVTIGAKRSGKTSLLRCLRGDQFRQKEPPTSAMDVPPNYCELAAHKTWASASWGVAYDEELSRVIINELLTKHTTEHQEVPPPLPPTRPRSSTIGGQEVLTHDAPPPVPNSSRPKTQRMSMLIERSPPSLPPIKPSGSHPEGFNLTPPSSPSPKPKKSVKRHFSFKIFRKSTSIPSNHHTRSSSSVVSNHTSHQSTLDTVISPTESSPPLPIRSLSTSQLPAPPFISAIPDNLMSKLEDMVKDCTNGYLPIEPRARLVDTPNQTGSALFKTLLLTKATILLVIYNTSLPLNKEGQPRIDHLLTELNALSLHSPLPIASLVLVGTHSDKFSTLIEAKNRLDKVRKALKASPFGDQMASGCFIVSCSSLFDHSAIEDVKKYLADTVKKRCRWEVPLRWLRCVRRFKSLPNNKQYFITLAEACSLIKELSISSDEQEIHQILEFLHSNLIILNLGMVKWLKPKIVTNPTWFFNCVSALLGLAEPSVESSIPPSLKEDYHQAVKQGTITDHLLDHLWPATPSVVKQELLHLLHSLELISLSGLGALPLSPWDSEKNLIKSPGVSPPISPSPSMTSPITSVFVPSIVQERVPERMTQYSPLDPLYFVSSRPNFPLSLLFQRLVIRCIQSHPSNSLHYKNASFYSINPTTSLLLQDTPEAIQVSLHPSHLDRETTPISPRPPAADTAMTVLMYIRAALSDICTQWFPSADIQLRLRCNCSIMRATPHYVIVKGTPHKSQLLVCQLGSMVTMSPFAGPWFGEEISHLVSDFMMGDENEYLADEDEDAINTTDIAVIAQALQGSWDTLGNVLSTISPEELDKPTELPSELASEQEVKEICKSRLRSSSFLDLLKSLENVGRPDVADSLIDSRMRTSGITL